MSASKDRKIVEMHAKISALQAERDALRQQQADDAKSLTAAANTIRELRAERNNWHVAADIELAKAITAEAELRGCTENLNDSCTTLAKVEAERDALAVENLTLRNAAVNAEERSEALREEVSLRRHSMPSEYAKLLAQRDYAMEMVNVQDGQIDALRALLKVARDCIYSLDAREIYDDELARIDAALAKGKA